MRISDWSSDVCSSDLLMAGQDKRVSGTWHVGDGEEAAAAAKLVGRMFDYDTLASGVRFDPEGTPPLYASLEVAGVPRNAPEPDFSQIKVDRKWYGTAGRPWKPAPLKEGEALTRSEENTELQSLMR